MAFHNVLSKCDRALVAYIAAKIGALSDRVFPSKNSADKTLNCVICWSERGIQEPMFSGNYTVTAHIQCRSLAAIDVNQDPNEPKQTSEDLVSAIFDLFHFGDGQSGEDLALEINKAASSVSDFTMIDVRALDVSQGYDDQHGRQMHGSCWVDSLMLEIECCPSDLGG